MLKGKVPCPATSYMELRGLEVNGRHVSTPIRFRISFLFPIVISPDDSFSFVDCNLHQC